MAQANGRCNSNGAKVSPMMPFKRVKAFVELGYMLEGPIGICYQF